MDQIRQDWDPDKYKNKKPAGGSPEGTINRIPSPQSMGLRQAPSGLIMSVEG